MKHEELAAMIAQSLIDAQVHADSAEPLSPERYAERVAQEFKDRGLIITTAKELATEFSTGLREQRTKVAEEIIAEIKRVIGGYPDNSEIRPKYERGGFLNDVDWAIDIVRRIGHVAP